MTNVWKINQAIPFLIEYIKNQNYTGTQHAQLNNTYQCLYNTLRKTRHTAGHHIVTEHKFDHTAASTTTLYNAVATKQCPQMWMSHKITNHTTVHHT